MKRFFMKTTTFALCLAIVLSLNGINVSAAKDKKAPKVTSCSLKNNQKNVGTKPSITVKFSENILKGKSFKKIKLSRGSKTIATVKKTTKNKLVVAPKSKLKKGEKYSLIIPAKSVKDKAGNALKKKFVVKFTTKKVAVDEQVTPDPSSTQSPTNAPTTEPTAVPTVEPETFPTPYWDVRASAAPRYVGRFKIDNVLNNAETTWPGAVIDAWFEGTEVSAKLSASDCYIQVVVDGKDLGSMFISSDSTYQLATGLESGIHNVQIVKRTEGWNNLVFKGFEFKDGQLLAPEPEKERKIQFVGDSITCGYGSEAANQNIPFSSENSSAYIAYGAVTSRMLNADYHLISVSGIGVLAPSGPGVIQSVYDRTMLWTSGWDHSSWQPNVVVVNISTNDMNEKYADTAAGEKLPSVEKFGTAYAELLTLIREKNPNAYIICTGGPMISGDTVKHAKAGIEYAMNQLNDNKISYFEYTNVVDGFGADWHPSKKTHQNMANQLSEEIKRITGWN